MYAYSSAHDTHKLSQWASAVYLLEASGLFLLRGAGADKSWLGQRAAYTERASRALCSDSGRLRWGPLQDAPTRQKSGARAARQRVVRCVYAYVCKTHSAVHPQNYPPSSRPFSAMHQKNAVMILSVGLRERAFALLLSLHFFFSGLTGRPHVPAPLVL